MANPLLLLFQTLLSTVVGALAAPALPNYASICRIKESSDGVICQCSPEINQLEINHQTLIQILQENQRQENNIISIVPHTVTYTESGTPMLNWDSRCLCHFSTEMAEIWSPSFQDVLTLQNFCSLSLELL